jgi:hypothetical protein
MDGSLQRTMEVGTLLEPRHGDEACSARWQWASCRRMGNQRWAIWEYSSLPQPPWLPPFTQEDSSLPNRHGRLPSPREHGRLGISTTTASGSSSDLGPLDGVLEFMEALFTCLVYLGLGG